jgi:hypothetical protein
MGKMYLDGIEAGARQAIARLAVPRFGMFQIEIRGRNDAV